MLSGMTTCELGSIPLEGVDWIANAASFIQDSYTNAHPFIAVFLCIAGTFMNVITVAVLTRPTMLSPVNVLLCAVAVCDIIVMSSLFVFVSHFLIISTLRCDPSDYSHSWAIFLFIHAQVTVVFHATSIWLTVLLAQIRVLTIRRATKAPTEAFDAKFTAILAIITLFLVVVMNIPNFMTFEIIEVPAGMLMNCDEASTTEVPESIITSTMATLTRRRSVAGNRSDFLPLLHSSTVEPTAEEPVVFHIRANEDDCALLKLAYWTNGLLFKVVPCILLTISIIALVKIISDVAHRRRSLAQVMNKKKMPRDHTTPMLVAVLSIFLIAELPQGVLHLGNAFFSSETFFRKIYQPLGDIMDLLSLVNSAVNFIIYCAMSRKFRIVFIQLMTPCLPPFIIRRLQDHLAAGDFEVSRSHRPSAITDLTKTEQHDECSSRYGTLSVSTSSLALASHRSSATSMLLRATSTENLARIYGNDSLAVPGATTVDARNSLLTVPGAPSMTPRVSIDDRSKPLPKLDVRSSLEIHDLRLVVPNLVDRNGGPRNFIASITSAISPSNLLRRARRFFLSRASSSGIGIAVENDKEPPEHTPLPTVSSPEHRMNLMQIEFQSSY